MYNSNYYQIGGSLNHKNRTYVERKADQDLFDMLNSSEYCFVLNSRQMGKSSLRVRINKKLVSQGIKCAFIDLSLIGTHITLEKWYKAMAYEILSTLDLHTKINLSSWWKQYDFLTEVQHLIKLIESVLFTQISSKIVIFIDEIDTLLKLDFKDDFFAFIRGCYNMRSQNPEYERLTFCLLGVATPTDLIQDKGRTPFNIGHSIELTGFTFAEAKNSLIPGLQYKFDHPETILQEVLYWSGGQPFLTQKICSLIVESSPESPLNVSQLIQEYLIKNWETQDEPEHLRTIRDRLLSNPEQTIELLSLYQQILTHPENPIFANFSHIQTELRLSGLVVQNNNILQVYNPIYKAIFNQDWIQEQLNNIRPYSTSLNQWLNSQNSIYLLKENELITGKQWTIDKRLSQEDYQFIAASQGEEDRLKNQEYQQRNQELLADNKKAQKMIKIGGLTLIITSIASVILAVTASIYTNTTITLFEKKIETEKSGIKILQEFQSNEIEGLILAIQETEKLKNEVKNNQSLVNYPTITPMVTLINILTKITQKNQLEGEEGEIFKQVSFSPDGQIIIAGSNKGKIKLWQKDGTLIKTIKDQGEIYSIAFSSDGEIIASGNNKGEIKLWRKDGTLIKSLTHNIAVSPIIKYNPHPPTPSPTGEGEKFVLQNEWNRYNSIIYSINFSSDNKIIVSGSEDGTIKFWRKDGTLINTINGHEGAVYSVNFSPDNKMIVSCSNDNTIKLWDKDGKFIRNIATGDNPFNTVNFSSNSQEIVSGSSDNTVQIWTIDGRLLKTLYGHNDVVNTVSFTPDNHKIISGSQDKTVKIWERQTGTLINTLNGHKHSVLSINVSKDGKMIVSGSDDQMIKIWQLPEYKDQFWISSVNFSPDGKKIIYSGGDHQIKIIQPDGVSIQNIPINGVVTNLLFSPDNKIIAFINNNQVQLWQNKKIIEPIPDRDVISINFTPENKLFTGSKNGKIKLWELNGKLIKTMNYNLGESKRINFSRDGQKIASTNTDGKIKIWDMEGKLITTLIDDNNEVTSVSFNPDNQIIASGDNKGKINIWRNDGQILFSINVGTKINSLNFNSDGKKLIIGTEDERLITWNLTPDELIKTGCKWLEEYIKTHPQNSGICPQN